MADGQARTEQDAKESTRIVLVGLAAGHDVHDLAKDLVLLHPKYDTFPGEVMLELGADVLDVAGASRATPISYEGISDRFLPECEFRGRENRKLQYALLSVGALHGGVELDILEEVYWWQTDDFWRYALYAFVAWTRAASEHAGLSVAEICERLGSLHQIDSVT